jgi:probable rRNA maturation factor
MEVLVSGEGQPFELLDRVRDAVLFTLEAESAPPDAEVSVSLVDDSAMAEMNERYRQAEGPTDVLAFAYGPDGASDGDAFALGDVAIAPAVAARQAAELGVSAEDEIELLAVHGALHLLGHEHDTDARAEAMEQRQREILLAFRRRSGPAGK